MGIKTIEAGNSLQIFFNPALQMKEAHMKKIILPNVTIKAIPKNMKSSEDKNFR